MGGTVSNLAPKVQTKKDFKITMWGPWASGKTTLLYRLKLGEVVQTIPSIGFNIEMIEHKNVRLTTLDFRSSGKILPVYVHQSKNSDGIIFVVDSADREGIEEAVYDLHELLSFEELREMFVLVLANKQDLPDAVSTAEIADRLNLYKLGRRRWTVQPISAVDGRGLDEALNWLISVLSVSP